MTSTETSGRLTVLILSYIEKLPHQIHIQNQLNRSLLTLVYRYSKRKLVQAQVKFYSTRNSKNFQKLKSIVTEQNTAFLTTTGFIGMSSVISSRPAIL